MPSIPFMAIYPISICSEKRTMIMNYINAIGQLLAMLVIFIATKYLTYNITEVWHLPKWLDFKPWSCNTCLTFWSLVAIYTTMLILGYTWLGISGLILAVLNAIAMWYDQRKKTVDVNQYHVEENKEN